MLFIDIIEPFNIEKKNLIMQYYSEYNKIAIF